MIGAALFGVGSSALCLRYDADTEVRRNLSSRSLYYMVTMAAVVRKMMSGTRGELGALHCLHKGYGRGRDRQRQRRGADGTVFVRWRVYRG